MNILPTKASFLITERCNFSCKYCFEQYKKNKNIMTEDIAKKSIDLLYNNAQEIKSNNVNVLLFGGEPLLNPKLIEVIFNYGLKKEKETGIKFTSDIITNGSIMNDYIYWLFMEYKDKVNLSCQLSIDGIKKVHNMYRVTKEGKGSFDLIEKNINTFKNIYRNHPEMLIVHGCINKKSLPYFFESYKFFREEWDIRNVWFMPIHEEKWTEDDLTIYKEELNKISNYILNKVKETNNTKEVHYFTPYNKCFLKPKKYNAPCGAGKSLITITANGEIYPCHNFYFNDDNKETKIGDIWNGINKDKIKLYRDFTCDDMSCPKECDHYNCYRCIATNWVYKGDMLNQIQGIYCKMQKLEKEFTDNMKKQLIKLNMYEERTEYKNQSNEYYDKNYKNIMSKAIQLLILKVTDLENEIKELKETIQSKE